MKFAPLILALLAAQPGAALACTIAPDPRPAQVQEDEWVRESYLGARAMVEVVAVAGSRGHRPGLVRVTRVLKGPIRRGRHLSLHPVPNSACGEGGFRRGSRGLILLDRLTGRIDFQGYLPPDYLQELDRLGLRPLAASAAKKRRPTRKAAE